MAQGGQSWPVSPSNRVRVSHQTAQFFISCHCHTFSGWDICGCPWRSIQRLLLALKVAPKWSKLALAGHVPSHLGATILWFCSIRRLSTTHQNNHYNNQLQEYCTVCTTPPKGTRLSNCQSELYPPTTLWGEYLGYASTPLHHLLTTPHQ